MPSYIPDVAIAQVQSAVDIVQLVSDYVPLKRAGRSYKALCPFHSEKTPSFMVNPEKQIYHCFGCNSGGNVFGFIMAFEKVGFPEAVRLLAKRAGIRLPEPVRSAEATVQQQRSENVYKVNQFAVEWFHGALLTSREGRQALEYLGKRHITGASIKQFKLGYAKPNYADFLEKAKRAGFSVEMLATAGLISQRSDGSFGAYFRGRLMFPIFDARGRPQGFGGRSLDGAEPKYLNSPETVVFQKRSCVYGLDVARQGILKTRRAVVVEGYTDCIMAWQTGVDGVVATLGTALTREHIQLLRRYADTVVLVYDADEAGKQASAASLDLFLEEDMPALLVLLPPDEDPCDLLLREGKEGFERRLEQARDPVDFKLALAKGTPGFSTVDGKEKVIAEVARLALKSSNPVKQALYLKRISEEMGVAELEVRRALDNSARKAGTPRARPSETRQVDASLEAQRDLLGVMIAENRYIKRAREAKLGAADFEGPLGALAEKVFLIFDEQAEVTLGSLLLSLPESHLQASAVSIVEEDNAKGNHEERFKGAISYFARRNTSRRLLQLREKIRSEKPLGNGRPDEVLRDYVELQRRRAGACLDETD